MEGYLLDAVKHVLMTELQAKGYAPHVSDVHTAAVKVINLIEADFKARFVNDKADKATLAEVDKVTAEMSPSDSVVNPVVNPTPTTPAVVKAEPKVLRATDLVEPV